MSGHLTSQEFGNPIFKNKKGRVVLQGDIVKDDLGSCALTDRARFMCVSDDSCKSNGCHSKASRMRRKSSGRSISLHPGQNGRCPIVTENYKVRMCRYLDTSTETQMAKIYGSAWKTSRSSCAKFVRSSFRRTIMGKAIRGSSFSKRLGKVPYWECFLVNGENGLILVCVGG